MSMIVVNITSVSAEQSFVKKVEKKKNSNQLKQEILEELEALLTQTIDMIASLGDLQKELIRKIQEIVVAPSDSFFAQAKPSGWKHYYDQLAHLKNQVDERFRLQAHWISDIHCNFQKG